MQYMQRPEGLVTFRVTSPFEYPEEFYYQYQDSVRHYKKLKAWSVANPDRMDGERTYKLLQAQKDATWHEYMWDRFENYVKNPKNAPKPEVQERKTKGKLVDFDDIEIEKLAPETLEIDFEE